MSKKFNYAQIQGVKGNFFVTDVFIEAVEKMCERIETKPEYVLAAMSFETGGTFNPAIQNFIKATGLIQFLPQTATDFGTTVDKLKVMTAIEQLVYVEKYLERFRGKLQTLEAVYTSILSGSPKNPDDVLFRAGTRAFNQNPLDWDGDGKITAREATAPVAARLFGGVMNIQQKLTELGVVPEELKIGFTDGIWGRQTTMVLAGFQKSKGLPESGLMNEATGNALFPAANKATKPTILKLGDKGDEVKKLQEAMVKLGLMTREQVETGHGNFGLKTETAVKRLQNRLGLSETGAFGDLEQTAVDNIISGIGKGNAVAQFVKILQTRLVFLNYLTQAQIDTGFGTFGLQTEAAVKSFQKDNLLPESGVVEAELFKLLFARKESELPSSKDIFAPEDTDHYTIKPNAEVFFTKKLEEKVAAVAKIYFEETRKKLVVTSAYRPPALQAQAIYDKIIREGESEVRRLYRRSGNAIVQILDSYRNDRTNKTKAVEAMRETIEKQMNRGIHISNHLRSNAIDIRKTAALKALDEATRRMGGRVIVEPDHYHLELT